jgi:CheY-like chemotaxis protein
MHDSIDVLLIDDCDSSARTTLAAIRSATPMASVVRVKDGEQALRLIFDKGLFTESPQIPRLIFLRLDELNADDPLLARLRDESEETRIPLVVLSATVDRSEIATRQALNANCLVTLGDAQDYHAEVARFVQQYVV